ncbi:phosphoribosyl-AMP cyclohydrolase [Methylophilaceae bacterium]|nr:phosphoribosyl-AMP cyclohydrolase [Methylophilaceae bacterium]
MKNWIDNIKWTEGGLVPVVVQDYISNKVIMFAWMNRLSLEASIKEKKAIYWSRSRKKIWTKGESSGHYQYIKDMIIDCDKDVLLLKVKQKGGISCHTGRESCFYFKVDMESNKIEECEKVLKSPDEIYKDEK